MCRHDVMYSSGHQNQQKYYCGRGWRDNTCRGKRDCTNYQKNKTKKQNLLGGPDGKHSRYAICGSTMNRTKNCQQRKLGNCSRSKHCIYESQ